MSVNVEPITSIDAIERNFARVVEELVRMDGRTVTIENIEDYENLATKLYLEGELNSVRSETQYAVGDIHVSESDTNPAEKFGYGEWEQVGEGRFLVGLGAGSGAVALAGSDDSPLEPYPVYFWRRKV